jgi:hypothetical protein
LVINLDSDAENGVGVREEGAWEAIRGIVRHYGGEADRGSAGPFLLNERLESTGAWETVEGLVGD